MGVEIKLPGLDAEFEEDVEAIADVMGSITSPRRGEGTRPERLDDLELCRWSEDDDATTGVAESGRLDGGSPDEDSPLRDEGNGADD